jgi:Spy/CpxP family protein refolding chaperone
MKRLTWCVVPLVAALVIGLVCSDLALAAKGEGEAKRDRKKGEKSTSGLRGEYAILAGECSLTADQEAALKAKIQARNQAMAEWQQANGSKSEEIRKAMKAAKEAGNKEEMKRLGEEMKALSAERRQMEEKTMADIYAILTSEQKQKWAGFRLYRQAMGWCKKANLTEEQQATVRKMADAKAKDVADAADEKAQRQVAMALRKEIEASVLSAEQREALGQKQAKERPEKKRAAGRKKDAGAEG